MRELARCIAWAIGLGTPALVVAAFGGAGLAQADGWWAWLVFVVYSPFYLLGHAFSAESASSLPDSSFDAVVFAAQFLYFLLAVAAVRYVHRLASRGKP